MARIALILSLAVLPFAVASPAGSVAKRVYHDPFGDASCCTRDLTDIAVGNDDSGMITFDIGYDGTVEGEDDDDLALLLDTDRNSATGLSEGGMGVDYMIGAHVMSGRADGIELYRWDGTQLREYRVKNVRVSVGPARIRVTVDRSLLGSTDGFHFSVSVFEVAIGYSYRDVAPDSGSWSFPLKIAVGRLRPSLTTSEHAHAGHRFVARLALRDPGTGRLLASGRVLCRASIGSRPLKPVYAAFAGRRASCSWHLPAGARGRTLHGSVGVAVTARDHISRSFRARVH